MMTMMDDHPAGEGCPPAATLSQDEVDQFWLKLVRDAYEPACTYFDTNIRQRIIADIRQVQGVHPQDSKYFTDAYRLRSKLFRPKTRTAIRKNEATAAAAFFSTEDVVSVKPNDDDDPLEVAAAAFHKALLQHRLTRPAPHGIPWFTTCIGAYQEADSFGVVASLQDWNKKLDRPDIELLPIEGVKFDPASDWRDVVNTSPYLIIERPMRVKDIRSRMQDGGWRRYDDQDLLAAAMPTTDTIRMAREQHGTDSYARPSAITDYTIVQVLMVFLEVDGMDVHFYTLGTGRMLSEPELVEERYPQGRPVVVGFSILEAHRTYKTSVPQMAREIQAEINDVANERRHAVRLANDKRYIVKRGRNVDLRSLTRNVPASVTLADDPNGDVRVVTSDDATASAYQEQDRLNLDFDDIAGTFSGSSVASNRRLNETVGGMNLLSANANLVSEYQLRTFTETWVEGVLRQVIILNQYCETNEVVLTMAAKRAGVPAAQITGEVIDRLLLRDVLLNVNVGTGALNPQTQLERFVYAVGAIAKILPGAVTRLNEEEVVKEIFGKCGYKDGKRFFRSAEQEPDDPRLMQLQEQIQLLTQKLMQKEAPELTEAKVAKLRAETALTDTNRALAEVNTMVRRMEVLFSAMQTAQTAVQVPGVTPVADSIARSVGFEDLDEPPIYPVVPVQQNVAQPEIPANTSPMFPAHPQRGMLTGMETDSDTAI